MALYLIAFNDEWTPDLTPQEVHRFPHPIGTEPDPQS